MRTSSPSVQCNAILRTGHTFPTFTQCSMPQAPGGFLNCPNQTIKSYGMVCAICSLRIREDDNYTDVGLFCVAEAERNQLGNSDKSYRIEVTE
mgnify:FL=1